VDDELIPANSHTTHGNRFLEKQTILTVLIWLLFLILSIRVFRPDSIYVVFDSDGAIPVLMANEDRPVTVFDTYYWGVDRWGGWPLMIARVVHQAGGFQWTDYSLHVVRAAWIFLGLLMLVWLNRRAALAVLVSGLIPLCLEPTVRWQLFTLSQVYAWQLTALFIAWLTLRRLLSAKLLPANGKRGLYERIAWSLGFYVSALLAIWSSEASVPFLGFLLLLEAARSYFLLRDEASNKWKWIRYITAFLLLAAATVSHALMKANYHRHGIKHWGGDYRASTWVDVGYLWENVHGTWRNLMEFDFVPLVFVSVVFLLVMTVVVVYAVLTKKRLVRERLRQVVLEEDVIMTIALAGIASINMVLMTMLSHVRLGGYNDRYLNPTFFFGSIAGLMTVYIMLRLVSQRLKLTRYVIPIAVAGAFLFLVIRFPHFQPSNGYKRDKQTALILAQKAPGGVIMGGYWETYIYAALQRPTNTMTPLPLEGLHIRIPWTPPMLRNVREAVIEYRHNEVMNRGPLPAELVQYGNVLKLKDPQFYQNDDYSFALYINEAH
jgi:hypothetical protein